MSKSANNKRKKETGYGVGSEENEDPQRHCERVYPDRRTGRLKRVAQLLDTQVSPATCRHEMSLLFDLGLLEQPHTSAGRIPSHLGFRVYLDKLLTCTPLTDVEKDEIDALFNIHNPDRTACWKMLLRRWPALLVVRPFRPPGRRGM